MTLKLRSVSITLINMLWILEIILFKSIMDSPGRINYPVIVVEWEVKTVPINKMSYLTNSCMNMTRVVWQVAIDSQVNRLRCQFRDFPLEKFNRMMSFRGWSEKMQIFSMKIQESKDNQWKELQFRKIKLISGKVIKEINQPTWEIKVSTKI